MNPFASLVQPIAREEEMDAAELSPERYAKVLADLSRINALTLAPRPTLGFLERVRARWGERRGIGLDLAGVDLNPNSEAVARARLGRRARLISGDYRDLAGQGWDMIMSSLVSHHMTPVQRAEFLRFMESEAACGWLVNDLHRHRLPFAGYPLLATLARVDPIVRRDGQLSVGRGFRRAEWAAMLAGALPDVAGECRIFRSFPWRLCVERIR